MKAGVFITLFTTLLSVAALANPPIEQGKAIFSTRCASCHSVSKVLTGPALGGLHDRRSIDWIVSFVQSSQTLIKSGDKDAVALFEKFNKIPMPDHADLSAADVKSIVDFIKSESTSDVAAKAPFAKPGSIQPGYTPLSITNYGFFLGYLAVVILLITALLFAVQLKEFERSRVHQAGSAMEDL